MMNEAPEYQPRFVVTARLLFDNAAVAAAAADAITDLDLHAIAVESFIEEV